MLILHSFSVTTCIRCIDASHCFNAISENGAFFTNFLFHFLALPKWSQPLKERICTKGANSFLKKLTPFWKRGKCKFGQGRFASPSCVPIYVCVCVPILVTTFPEWLSGTEPLPHTPGAVRPSSLCLYCFACTCTVLPVW